jgi:hypothetical protein
MMSPESFACITASDREEVWQVIRSGVRCTVFRDYPGSPWSWSVEDARDGRLIAFRGTHAERTEAIESIEAWLASPDGVACQGGKRAGFDVPPRAA